jgi:hypothetical protein
MSIFSRFFGRKEDVQDTAASLTANPQLENPLSLQLLFSDGFHFQASALEKVFRSYHRSMAKARVEFDAELAAEGKLIGLIGWGKHVIRLIGFDMPMPGEAVEGCVAPAHYPRELKEQARAHAAHILLFYAGYETSPFEQYVALAAVAGVFSRFGAIVVLNESARTSLPAGVFFDDETEADYLELIRAFPLSMLFCGFVKYEVEGIDGVWMRTYGAHLLGLPDFAAHAAGHHEGQRYFDIFESVHSYLRSSGAELANGHTMQIEEEEYLRMRGRWPDEDFLESEGELLVMEIIGPDEINK